MVLAGKLEVDVKLKSSAEKLFRLFSSRIHHIPNASPDNIHGVEVHEGDWETPGSLKLWKYTIDGKPEIFKEKMEIDETNKSVTLIAVEGHVLELYKSYKDHLQFISKHDGDDLVKITLNYEKFKADDEAPTKYLDFVVNVVKDIDAHLAKA